ncbi:MAG: ATP-dependent helicase [Methylacidiphilales bacterium]|nr:ATP-dependent helicase [Candidatus Methylacidiphilales bacterium]
MAISEKIRFISESLNLTEEQVNIIQSPWPKMVIAGPGTGKTTTLVANIYALIAEGVPPANILAITFSRIGVKRMIDRLSALLNRSIAYGINVMTTDALARRMIYSEASFFGNPDKRLHMITENQEVKRTEDLLYKALIKKDKDAVKLLNINLDKYFGNIENFNSYEILETVVNDMNVISRLSNDNKNKEMAFKRIIELCQKNAMDFIGMLLSSKLSADKLSHDDMYDNYIQTVADLVKKINGGEIILKDEIEKIIYLGGLMLLILKEVSKPANTILLDSLKHYAHVLMLGKPYIMKVYAGMYPYIFYDEFQDIALGEYAILNALIENHSTPYQIAVFGDPNQSIYQFRGSLGIKAYELLATGYINHSRKKDKTKDVDIDKFIYYLTQDHRSYHPELTYAARTFLKEMMDKKGFTDNMKDISLSEHIMKKYVLVLYDNILNNKEGVCSLKSLKGKTNIFSHQPSGYIVTFDEKYMDNEDHAKFIAKILKEVQGNDTQCKTAAIICQDATIALNIEKALIQNGISFSPFDDSFLKGDAFSYIHSLYALALGKEDPSILFTAIMPHFSNHQENSKLRDDIIKIIKEDSCYKENVIQDMRLCLENESFKEENKELIHHLRVLFDKILEMRKNAYEAMEQQNEPTALNDVACDIIKVILSQNYDHVFKGHSMLEKDIQKICAEKFNTDDQVMLDKLLTNAKQAIIDLFIPNEKQDRRLVAEWIDWLANRKYSEDKISDLNAWTDNCNEIVVHLLKPRQAKGLEYDIVFIPFFNNVFPPFNQSDENKNLCYVSITRARRLTVITTNGKVHDYPVMRALKNIYETMTPGEAHSHIIAYLSGNHRRVMGQSRNPFNALYRG